jgi:hypothetical protein
MEMVAQDLAVVSVVVAVEQAQQHRVQQAEPDCKYLHINIGELTHQIAQHQHRVKVILLVGAEPETGLRMDRALAV